MTQKEEPLGVVVEHVDPDDQWQKFDYYYRSPYRYSDTIARELFDVPPRQKFRQKKQNKKTLTARGIYEILRARGSLRARSTAIFGGNYTDRHRYYLLHFPVANFNDIHHRLKYPRKIWYGPHGNPTESDNAAYDAIGGQSVSFLEYDNFPRIGNEKLKDQNFEVVATLNGPEVEFSSREELAEILENFARAAGIPENDFFIVNDTMILREKIWALPATFKGLKCFEITNRNRRRILTDVVFSDITVKWPRQLKKITEF
jgi:hypothetical protein